VQRAGEILQDLQSILFVLLGLVAVYQWLKRPGKAERWVALTFGDLATIVIIGQFLPEPGEPRGEAILWVLKTVIAVLVLFPFFVFRFAGTFQPIPVRWRMAADGLTMGVVASTFALKDIPQAGEDRPAQFVAWLAFFLFHWVILSVYAAIRLWRGGHAQPPVARNRMRTMAIAFAGLAILLLVSGTGSSDPKHVKSRDIVTRSIGLLSSPLFLMGFAPPAFIVWLWRRKDEEALRESEVSLMQAREPRQIGEVLLPHATRLVGGSAAVLLAPDRTAIASFGSALDVDQISVREPGEDVQIIPGEHATLHVRVGRYAPYFGREELRILQTLAALADLALSRSQLLAEQARMVDTLRATNETLRDFVAIASHDLRTPLTVVQGLVEMLDEHWMRFDEAKKREQISAIRRQAHHLSRLVEDLLTVSKIDAGAVQPQLAVLDVRSALANVVRDFTTTLGTVAVEAPEGLIVRTDPEHLSRMVWNYLQNATVYGAPPVFVEAREAGSRVEIRVSDSGPGVPPEFRDRMFDKFVRADKRTSKAAAGTGLGLAIVRGLARASGGDAWYEDRGRGACFVVALPKETRLPEAV